METFTLILGILVVLSGIWGIVSPERFLGERARGRLAYRLVGLVAVAGGLLLIGRAL